MNEWKRISPIATGAHVRLHSPVPFNDGPKGGGSGSQFARVMRVMRVTRERQRMRNDSVDHTIPGPKPV